MQDYDGRTALMLAAAQGHKEIVELLLEAGAARLGSCFFRGLFRDVDENTRCDCSVAEPKPYSNYEGSL